MPRNTALHSRTFVPPTPAGGAGVPGGAQLQRSSTGSASGSTASGASIATTPANQLMTAASADSGRTSGASAFSDAAPAKLPCSPTGSQSSANGAAPGSLGITALEARMQKNCNKDVGTTPWAGNRTATGAGSVGKSLNFSTAESPKPAAQPEQAPLCHCPDCHIQILTCIQCSKPLVPGPENPQQYQADITPLKAQTAFSVFKEEHLAASAPKGTPMKARLQMVAKMWSAAAESVRAEYTEKAKKLNAQPSAFTMSRGKRLRDGDAPQSITAVPPPVKEKVKRPPSSYMNFVAAKRAEVTTQLKATNAEKEGTEKLEGTDLHKWVFKETAGRISMMWKELSEEEKAKFKHPAGAASDSAGVSAAPSATSSVVGGEDDLPCAADLPGDETDVAALPLMDMDSVEVPEVCPASTLPNSDAALVKEEEEENDEEAEEQKQKTEEEEAEV